MAKKDEPKLVNLTSANGTKVTVGEETALKLGAGFTRESAKKTAKE